MEDQKLEGILNKMDGQINTIAVAVVGMQGQLKDMVTKDELQEAKSEILDDVDRFTKLHETLDQELSMLRSKYNRLEERVLSLEQRTFATA